MARRAIVIAVEGLGCNMLGAYGGSWCETPNLNASTIRGLTCDQFWLDSIRLATMYRSMWFGRHACEPDAAGDSSLAELIAQSGAQTLLVTDQADLIEVDGFADFEEVIELDGEDVASSDLDNEFTEPFDQVEPRFKEDSITDDAASDDPPTRPSSRASQDGDGDLFDDPSPEVSSDEALSSEQDFWNDEQLAEEEDEYEDVPTDNRRSELREPDTAEQTAMGKLFENALANWMAKDQRPALMWVHAKGWRGTWDAPYSYREELVGDDDPPPPGGQRPPEMELDADSDPDLMLGWAQASAAQARVLDEVWGWLREMVENEPDHENLMIVLVGVQGYPMGEHQTIGLHRDMLYAERIHCPLILWKCGEALGRRSNELVQPADLWRTLVDWLQIDAPQVQDHRNSQNVLQLPSQRQATGWRARNQFAYAAHDEQWMLRTPAWCGLRGTSVKQEESNTDSDVDIELYVHPEDRWQKNDVASRATEVVESVRELQPQVAHWLACPAHNGEPEEAPIPDVPRLLIDSPT